MFIYPDCAGQLREKFVFSRPSCHGHAMRRNSRSEIDSDGGNNFAVSDPMHPGKKTQNPEDEEYNLDKRPGWDTYSSAGLYFSDAPAEEIDRFHRRVCTRTCVCTYIRTNVSTRHTFPGNLPPRRGNFSDYVGIYVNNFSNNFRPRFTKFLRRWRRAPPACRNQQVSVDFRNCESNSSPF